MDVQQGLLAKGRVCQPGKLAHAAGRQCHCPIVVVCLPLVHQNKYWGVRGVYQAHIEMWMQHIPRRNLLLLSHDELQFSPGVTTQRCVTQLYAV